MNEFIFVKINGNKKPSAEKKLPQMLPASIVIRSEGGAPITIPILLEGGLFLFSPLMPVGNYSYQFFNYSYQYSYRKC